MREIVLFSFSLLITYFLTNRMLKLALKRELYDLPTKRGSHVVPKPRLGGVAIVVSFYIVCLVMVFSGRMPFPDTSSGIGILVGGLMTGLVGVVDDIRELNAKLKLAAQIIVVTVVVLSGVRLEELRLPFIGNLTLGFLAIPVTYIWILGVMNFYNFIDGIDGLAAGIGLIAAAFLIFISAGSQVAGLAAVYAIIAGVSFGFLRYNFPPARIFMGDTGSTFIGFMFASLAVYSNGRGVPVFVTALILGAVLGDAFLTLSRRVLEKKPIFSPHRTHYYQRLTSLGFSHKQVTLLEYLVTSLLGVSGIFFMRGDSVFIIFFTVIWLSFFLWVLVKIRTMEKGKKLYWEGKTLAIAVIDLILIAGSYVLSYYLRLNFSFPEAETSSMLISLPIVLVIRTAVFYYNGLYRAVWRYVTLDDLMRIVKAVSFSTLLNVVIFTFLFRFESFPRSVFIIDMFILTVFMSGSRVATRWFHDLPKHEEVTGKRVAIVGTGHTPEAVLRRIRNTRDLQAVGYLDDREEMEGRVVGGIKVLGGLRNAREILSKNGIEELIIMDSYIDRMPPGALEGLKRKGVSLRIISGPDDISEDDFTGFEVFPFEDGSVFVAGNGILVKYAKSVFHKAAKLVVVPSGSTLDSGADFMERDDRKDFKYVGITDSPELAAKVFSEHGIGYMVLDFSMSLDSISNKVHAYFHEIFMPMMRLSRVASSIEGIKVVVISRISFDGDGIVKDASRLAESAILALFRDFPERLVFIRNEYDVSRHWYRKVLLKAEGFKGGLFVAQSGAEAGDPVLKRVEAAEPYHLDDESFEKMQEEMRAGGLDAAEKEIGQFRRRGAGSE